MTEREPDHPLITMHADWMSLAGMTDRTIHARRMWLARLERGLPLGLAYASAEEIHAVIAELARKGNWCRQTLATNSRHTRMFYKWAIEDAKVLAPPDPTAALPKPRVPQRAPRPVKDEVLEKILAEAGEPFRLWALLASMAGLRCVEISRLWREHMDEAEIQIVRGKGDAPDTVPMQSDIWIAVRDLPAGPVARQMSDGRPAAAGYISRAFLRHVRFIGVDAGLHQLRHWFGTMVLQRTGNMRTAQRLLRHKSIASTVLYTEVRREDLVAAVAALPRLGDVR